MRGGARGLGCTAADRGCGCGCPAGGAGSAARRVSVSFRARAAREPGQDHRWSGDGCQPAFARSRPLASTEPSPSW
ncbi:hypothetical protein KPP03845_300072 (plasmid) [Streptomyces xanthophaeus]|nr:hypothetical protein KPP03845_300072 [Streptomyces xanthophaeus]